MYRPVRTASWSAGLAIVLVGVVIGSAALGPVKIDPITVAMAALNAVVVPSELSFSTATLPRIGVDVPLPGVEYTSVFDFEVQGTHQTIVGDIRLPRIVLAAIVGFSLAAAGTVMQGFFRNPLADPSIIGVSSGAAAGAVAAIAFPALVPLGSLHLSAFIGALGTAFLVYAIATEGGRTPVATLLLAGVAIQAFLGAMISYMLVHSGDDLREAVVWMMGHLHNSTWSDVQFALPVTIAGVGILLAYTREMNVLLLGEEDAHHLGVDVERTKLLLLALASVVTAAGVAVAGVIGFVGLVVPHIMRLLVGPDHRILLPTSALAGASFLVITDTIARLGAIPIPFGPDIATPIVPVGIITAALGAPFFLFLLTRREVHAV
ncbi:vitamin B12 ABC transporter permease BtuC [Natronolimnohabitans innermongolicus]|uniref:Cobalamin import system permease protein BtuC n=1 Tax=Natronolimnohabitans innermongolicus JCM 12255 TaxID=1227499 RepID=L9XLB8_9EURY|nr:vitamin B12 ABC transporter permease BtuC [Natronolimnohabitans innermongolicus]ELY62201.1 corrinoid ABC transporter permease [Natronolimnohabitans innermongolicus JCM 12255]